MLTTWLTIFKYLGLALAAGSSIWGTVGELTVKKANGRRRLTTAGIVAIALTLLGLVVSVVSEELQGQQAASDRREQVAVEIASQPLASLSFHLQFSSTNAALWDTIKKGAEAIHENDMSTQGGVPYVWYDTMEYSAELLPLASFIARAGDVAEETSASDFDQSKEDSSAKSIVVLMPLDDSANTILSFGGIEEEVRWSESNKDKANSAGFHPSDDKARTGNSTPYTTVTLAADKAGISTYAIDWQLDPRTLAQSIDRNNTAIGSMARLPKVLKLAILYDIHDLPFRQNDFGLSYASNLWSHADWGRQNVTLGQDMTNVAVSIEVNDYQDAKFNYALKRMYRLTLINDAEDEFETKCTILEFEAS